MAAASNQFLGIDPKMYRHFAVITVAISTIVAVFADGDAQEAMAQGQLHAQKQAAANRTKKAELIDNRSDEKKTAGRWGSASTGNYGAPMDGSASAGGNSSVIPAGMTIGPPQVVIELDQKALARMTPEQRAAYLRKLEEERQRRLKEGPVMPTQAQINALAAQSAARSGSDEID
jgi:hypothetical protein